MKRNNIKLGHAKDIFRLEVTLGTDSCHASEYRAIEQDKNVIEIK